MNEIMEFILTALTIVASIIGIIGSIIGFINKYPQSQIAKIPIKLKFYIFCFAGSFLSTAFIYLITLSIGWFFKFHEIYMFIFFVGELVALIVFVIIILLKQYHLNRHAMDIAYDLQRVRQENLKSGNMIYDLNKVITTKKNENRSFCRDLERLEKIQLKKYPKRTRDYISLVVIKMLLIPTFFWIFIIPLANIDSWLSVIVFFILNVLISMVSFYEDVNLILEFKVTMTNKMYKKHIEKYKSKN